MNRRGQPPHAAAGSVSSKTLDEDIGDRPKNGASSGATSPTGNGAFDNQRTQAPRERGDARLPDHKGVARCQGSGSSRRFGRSVRPPPPRREPRHRPTWTKPYTPETSNAPEAARDAFSKFPNVSSSSGPMASSDRSKPPNPKPSTHVAGTPSRSSVGAVYDVVQAFPPGEGVERGPSTNASEHPPRRKFGGLERGQVVVGW